MFTGLKAPFPYFGGKATVADIVWQALGQRAGTREAGTSRTDIEGR